MEMILIAFNRYNLDSEGFAHFIDSCFEIIYNHSIVKNLSAVFDNLNKMVLKTVNGMSAFIKFVFHGYFIIQQTVGFVKCYFTIAKILKPRLQFIPILMDEDFLPRVLNHFF